MTAPQKRSDKDFAIEHAGYMANAAKHLLECVNAEAAAREAHEHSWDLDTEAARARQLEIAKETTGEAMRTLASRVYEFEKRRDRSAANASTETGYELHGHLVYETKFGGQWDFHPKDELLAGDFLKHREHTPVYVRCGAQGISAGAVSPNAAEQKQQA